MSVVELSHVFKTFSKAERPSVQDVNLRVRDGEFMVLVGPSGCGKTTTLRMIAGLEEVSEGLIFIDGRDVTGIEPKDRNIAMVFQNYALYPTMTVYNNIAFPLKAGRLPVDPLSKRKGKRLSRSEIDARVHEVAEVLDLVRLLDRKPAELSGGEKQRVALARAMVRKPLLFLMDEPLSNLDAQLRVQTRSEIMKLHSRLGATFLYVTHDQIEAMTMGDRVVVMDKGIVQQVGTPYEVFHHPSNLFVAGFIGSPAMNFFDGTLERVKDLWIVKLGESYSFYLPDEISGRLDKNQDSNVEVVVGVRPEHTLLCTPGQGVALKVVLQEITGSEVLMRCEFQGRALCVQTVFSDAETPEVVHVAPDVNKVHLFDKSTGASMLAKHHEAEKDDSNA